MGHFSFRIRYPYSRQETSYEIYWTLCMGLKSWAALYDNCTFAAKKMVVSQFIKSIHVYRDYTLDVEFNVAFDEFRKFSAETINLGNERTEVYARAE